VVPDSSIFTAKEPNGITYSYVKLSVKKPQPFGETAKGKKEHCRMDDVSVTAIGLCINKGARAKI
jgi:hypothetical protein